MITIINSNVIDALRTFEDNFIDIIVTSPPYNQKGGRLVKKVIYDTYDDSMDEDDYQNWQVEVLNELYRITKPGGHLFYNHKIRYKNKVGIHPLSWIFKTDWKLYQEIIWNRKITPQLRRWRFYPYTERIYWLRKPPIDSITVPKEIAKYGDVWEISPKMKDRDHPAPFPEEIPKRCIQAVGKEGDYILDPFMGTGTTLIVAVKLGFENVIGIDVSEEYCKRAKEKIKLLTEVEL